MLLSYVGSFAQPGANGSQAITGVGFMPKLVLFFGNQQTADGNSANANFFIGAAVSSSDRRCASGSSLNANLGGKTAYGYTGILVYRVIDETAAVKSSCDFTSMDRDGFTVNWGVTDANARQVNFLALGGNDLANVKTGSNLTKATTGNFSVTGLGFKPDALILFSSENDTVDPVLTAGSDKVILGFAVSATQRSYVSNVSKNGVATTACNRVQKTNQCYGTTVSTGASINLEMDFVSFDTDGFTLNATTVPGAGEQDFFYWVALQGGKYTVGAFNQATGNGNQSVTGFGFLPSGVLLKSFNNATSAAIVTNARMSLGAGVSSSKRGCIWEGDANNLGTSVSDSDLSRVAVLRMLVEGAIGATVTTVADYVSNDTRGFTINNTTTDATAREIIYFGFGSSTHSLPLMGAGN